MKDYFDRPIVDRVQGIRDYWLKDVTCESFENFVVAGYVLQPGISDSLYPVYYRTVEVILHAREVVLVRVTRKQAQKNSFGHISSPYPRPAARHANGVITQMLLEQEPLAVWTTSHPKHKVSQTKAALRLGT